jgi:hypothetical protein
MQQGANSRQIRKYGKTLCSCLPAGTLFILKKELPIHAKTLAKIPFAEYNIRKKYH